MYLPFSSILARSEWFPGASARPMVLMWPKVDHSGKMADLIQCVDLYTFTATRWSQTTLGFLVDENTQTTDRTPLCKCQYLTEIFSKHQIEKVLNFIHFKNLSVYTVDIDIGLNSIEKDFCESYKICKNLRLKVFMIMGIA